MNPEEDIYRNIYEDRPKRQSLKSSEEQGKQALYKNTCLSLLLNHQEKISFRTSKAKYAKRQGELVEVHVLVPRPVFLHILCLLRASGIGQQLKRK